ncbi:MocR-like pyridoxine biosynthesis transcription factor PdxR [Niallia sp. 03133]|uniref:MocR-like pyridoxine biosynthesis transcription factor PdxR n=1 Tax=Niallia sp. 03133 TaxID=3458060 RepID=UPI004043BED0
MIFTTVDRTSSKSLTQQVYEQIRKGILDKKLLEGQKLFSTRELASTIGVSRNVVLEAYERLISEGYLEVKPKSGTFVAKGTSLSKISDYPYEKDKKETKKLENAVIDFKGGNPAIDHFPRKKWGQLTKEVCSESQQHIFGYSDSCGIEELRNVLAVYLQRARGVQCQPDQIIITSGATQGLRLITELLISDRQQDYIAVEDPVTDEMRNIFSYANAKIHPVSVDENGIIPELLPKERPSFVFVIPSHQFPLGGILSIQRRLQLIEYARKMDCYIVEDDYDSEFTYEGAPVPSMQGIEQEHVLYVGTFSKILSPALRIGYVVLPPHLVEDFQQLKWFTDRHTSSIEQFVLARFIEDGHFDRHIRKMKKIYQERREVLVNSILLAFKKAKIIGKAAGMHLVVEIPNVDFTKEICDKITSFGVRIYPVEQYSMKKGEHKDKIVMGYGGLTAEQIKKGVKLLKKALNQI